MRKVKSRLALLLAVIMIAGSLQLPVFAVRRSGAGIPSGASAEAGVEDPGQVTETELLDLVPDSAGTGGTEPQDPVDTTWTVIFDANGGTLPGGETQISLDVEKGLAVQFNSEPLTTADRYFAGWKTQDGTLINDAYSFVPENDITLYAFWKDKKKVENISLNHHELTMSVGKTAALSATVLPEDAYDRSFTWKSGNPGVAAVNNNGKVTAAAKGTAVIKAAANDGSGVFAECKITVRQPVTSLTLNKTSLTVNKGATSTLSATAGPSDANNKTVKWTTSDSSVATVSSAGEVKGVKRGTATITATAADGSGKKATCSVTVKQPVTSLTLNKTALTLNNGKTATLTATVGPSNANNKTVKWTTSNSAVATVSSTGVVKGLKRGTATITATAADGSGKKAACKVTVTKLVTSLTLNKTVLPLQPKKTEKLTATVSPSDADNKTVKWTTSNSAVATVNSNGKVTAKGKGTAIIKATAADGSGENATCTVTVVTPKKSVSSVTLKKTSLTMQVGKTEILKVTVKPTNAVIKNVIWTSSNTKVATVDSKGKVKAIGKGTATITATAADGSGKNAACKVTVVKKIVTGVTIKCKANTVKVKKTLTLTATVQPTNADIKDVTWKSSNTKVATVDSNGKVCGIKKGTVTITATAKDGSGKKDTMKVTVK